MLSVTHLWLYLVSGAVLKQPQKGEEASRFSWVGWYFLVSFRLTLANRFLSFGAVFRRLFRISRGEGKGPATCGANCTVVATPRSRNIV